MVFLNPSILLGLLASLIPVIIHLLNLRKLKRIEFSTLDFLKELQKNKIKRIKIKQWILLALRVLIILLLVASFARPTLESTALGGNSAAKTTAVFLLDDSPSMSVIGDNGNYFNRAKETIKQILDQFNEGDEIHLLTSSGNTKYSSINRTNINEYLGGISITDISGSITSSLDEAVEIFDEGDNFNRELYIFSDKQPVSLKADSTTANLLAGISENNARVYYFNLHGESKENTGISGLRSNNQIFELNKPVTFSAIITNYNTSTADNVVASLSINGEKVARKSTDIGPGENKLVTFETTLKTSGFLDIKAELENDGFENDNTSYLSVFVPEKIPVAIFYNSPKDISFINAALQEAETSGAFIITRKTVSQITSVNLSDYKVVVLAAVPDRNNFELLDNYLRNGGGMIYYPDLRNESAEEIFYLSGISTMDSEVITNPNGTEYAFSEIEVAHPVFTNLFKENTKPEPAPLTIYQFLKYKAPANLLKIITLEDGSPLLTEFRDGEGKALIYNVAADLISSDFPLTGLFAPLLNKGIYYLANTNESDSIYFAGNKVTLNTSNYPYGNIRVELPDGNSVYFPADSVKKTSWMEFNQTNLAGLYKVYSENKQLDCFAINISTGESVSIPLSDEKVAEFFEPLSTQFTLLTPEDNYNTAIMQARFGTELWRFFLVFALILALIEMLLARNSKKDIAELK